jgi:hypothetical protein
MNRLKMPEVNGKGPFEERLDIVMDELSMGIRWERSSLILAVYRSEIIKKTVQSTLFRKLVESGQAVFQYSVDESHFDIPVDLQNHPHRARAVYFVTGLGRGGGRGYSNAFRALNMHREYLIEGNIRAIFWLTKKEAKQCSRFAPDFWVFRHKVVDFFELPSTAQRRDSQSIPRSIGNLYPRSTTDFKSRITAAQQLVDMGCFEDAILNYRNTLRLYPDQKAINLQIAEIYLIMGQLPAAGRILLKSGKEITLKGNFKKELNRLKRVANSVHPRPGGFLDQQS